jgi:dihydroxyacetone kinase-like predicted kinase
MGDESEIISIYYGQDVTGEQAEALVERLGRNTRLRR